MSRLDETIYVIEQGKIAEGIVRDFCQHHLDETTTPLGIMPRYHVRGAELWSWGPSGQFPHKVAAFDTEAEAVEALEDEYALEFFNNPYAPPFFWTREEAEEALRTMNDAEA